MRNLVEDLETFIVTCDNTVSYTGVRLWPPYNLPDEFYDAEVTDRVDKNSGEYKSSGIISNKAWDSFFNSKEGDDFMKDHFPQFTNSKQD